MSLLETAMTFVQTQHGRIRKDSAFYKMLEADCKRIFKTEEPTDFDINMIFMMIFHTSEETQTVSAEEKNPPVQYHNLGYFQSSTINVGIMRQKLLLEFFPEEEKDQDISDSFLEFLKRFKLFVVEKMTRKEQELRETIKTLMEKDGLRTHAGRF